MSVKNEFTVIALFGLLLLALIAFGVQGLPAPLAILRLLLGLAYVLFVPGYVLQAALFPRAADLDGPERLALSFGLSVAAVPPLALLLDQLPWGLRLWPIVVAQGLFIAACSVIALWRRRSLPLEERPRFDLDLDLRGWWADQDRLGRLLYGLLAAAFLLALISAATILFLPRPDESLTEFYILGPGGLAEDFPRQAAPSQSLSVTVGIANHEGSAITYHLEVRLGEQRLNQVGPISLEDGQVWQQAVEYALPGPGADQQVDFLLYRDAPSGQAEPYRRLRLWIDVVEEDPS
jgi:uncharacterized membrane protein